MIDVPIATPPTEHGLTVGIAILQLVLLLDHVPPEGALDKLVLCPTHTFFDPPIVLGIGFTVIE